MQIEKNIKKQIATLQKMLQEGRYSERDFFILNPERSYQFDWAEHKRMSVLAKYLYIKEGVPFVADTHFNEVEVECLNMTDIEDLCQSVRNGQEIPLDGCA